MEQAMQRLKDLSEMAGVPGREEAVRTYIEARVADLVDSVETDAMGNLHALKRCGREGAPRLMVAAHMDEIGFIVRHVDDKGFLRLQHVGGFDARNLFARQVTVHPSAGGEPLVGVLNPASKPVHVSTAEERAKVPELASFYVDLGLSGEQVGQRVRVGDMVTLRQPFADLGEVVTGKALDDRSGCWILLETLARLERPAMDVHAVFTVQEEVGLRGATTSAFQVAPDIAVALDTTLALDTPGNPDEAHITEMGKGTAIKVMDSHTISTRWLVDAFIGLAEQNDVPYQLEVLPMGGTDAGAMQRSRGGAPAITLSTPSRYVHTVTEMVAKADLEAAVALLAAAATSGIPVPA
ncbi:MAG TPA: M20/M25/M40 family metallo-hydrolase [Trueperaceae bacterium]|nr:M20/M25/M40 family metallo-hydrolase [Trueperaceae bacterium]